MKNIVILGATGSIGSNTLDVIRSHPGEFRVVGLAAARPGEKLAALAREFPDADIAVANDLENIFQTKMANASRRGKIYSGRDSALNLVRDSEADTCVAGISGTAGLQPTFAAAHKGMRILLANKEVLVSAGRLFNEAVHSGNATVLPLDSEHAALWQCLEGRDRKAIDKVWITASGGPFRTWTKEQMASATPADAVNHPKWSMGAKISVDSATLANKALEVIEACMLFDFSVDAVGILVHPQSAVHGIVEFADGTQIAHMGICDMRQPASYMLFYPERRANTLPRLDLVKLGRLDFSAPDLERFPLLAIGLEACRLGGGYPALFNAANETAVNLFLREKISFADLPDAVAFAMRSNAQDDPNSLDDVAAIHLEAARKVREFVSHSSSRSVSSRPERTGMV